MKKNIFLLLFILVLISIFSSFVLAEDINITVEERGKIVSFYDEYYIYQVNGTLTVNNPSNNSLFNIELPLSLSTLDIRTNYSKEGNYLTAHELFVYALEPQATETFHYKIVGISTEDLSAYNKAVLARAITVNQPKIYSNLFGSLQKAELEDADITGRNARLVSVELRNPTSFEYQVDKVEVIKSLQNNPNAEVDTWVFTGEKVFLDPYENWAFDFIDDNASEGEIYWLTTDIYIDQILVSDTYNISHFNQDDLFLLESNVTLNESFNESLPFLSDRVYLRKLVSSTLVVPGDVVNVTVLVNNLEAKEVDVNVYDTFPQGFEVVNVEGGNVVGNNISWNLTLSSGSAKRLRYQLKYVDTDLLGLDYFMPAQLVYGKTVLYSQNLPFVRKYVPEKKLFVQKNVEFLAGDAVQVTLSLQNLGESSLQNLMLKEYLLSTAEFREISQQPLQRGLWEIKKLNQSSIWTVTYVTDKLSLLNNMPEVYGVSQGSVLQTIILSNLISSKLSLVSTNIIEIVGIVILALLLLLYFVPQNYFSRVNKNQKKDLRLMSQELSLLKNKTDRHNQTIVSSQKTSSVLRPQAPGQKMQRTSVLQEPERVARHQALDATASKLEEVKKSLSDKDEETK